MECIKYFDHIYNAYYYNCWNSFNRNHIMEYSRLFYKYINMRIKYMFKLFYMYKFITIEERNYIL